MKKYLIGIDEVGRGPIAGPVSVCVFKILNSKSVIAAAERILKKTKLGFKDSKKLSPVEREDCFKLLRKLKLGEYSVSHVSHNTIDRFGISYAIQLAMQRGLRKVKARPSECRLVLDAGLKAPARFQQEAFVKGDERFAVIALASIIAKIKRDKRMESFAKKFSVYNFERNKGYGTSSHIRALRMHGPCDIHRTSFLGQLLSPDRACNNG